MKSKRNITFLFLAAIIIITLGITIYFAKIKNSDTSKKTSSPNIIIISLTNLSANHMASYGYKRVTTPYLDRLAHQSFFFENVFAQTSWTLPSATSIFTATYPYNHRLMSRYYNNKLTKNLKTLAQILKIYGYQAAAFTGGGDYRKGHGLERGFDTYDGTGDFLSFKRSFTKATNWLNRHKNKKFFLFVQGYDMHAPFTPQKPFDKKFWKNTTYKPKFDTKQALRGFEKAGQKNKYRVYYYKIGKESPPIDLDATDVKFLESQYDGEVAYVDSLLENFLNGIDPDILNNSYLIIQAEHGELFGKHGRFGRAGTIRGSFYDEVLKVPLVIKYPGQTKGKKIQGLTQLIDISPTIFDWLNITQSAQFQGKSLTPLINKNRPINSYVFGGSDFGHPDFDLYTKVSRSEMIRNFEWKLIREITLKNKQVINEQLELYNIKKDPNELNNLVNKNPLKAKLLKARLFKWAQGASSKYKNQYYPIPKKLEEEAKKHGYW